ncbi:MAG TPA: hypothetical protein VNQ77_09045 [Frankiaceae bacterium]|nr:hypothetical protein [Frankiaceae bacterium]
MRRRHALALLALVTAVPMPAANAAEPSVDADCLVGATGTGDGSGPAALVFEVVVTAEAAGGATPGLASATCTLYGSDGSTGSVSTRVPAPRTAGAGVLVLPPSVSVRLCVEERAIWTDGTVVFGDTECRTL